MRVSRALFVVALNVFIASEASASGWVRRYPMPQGRTVAVTAARGGFVFVASGERNVIVTIDGAGNVQRARTLPAEPNDVAASDGNTTFVVYGDTVSKLGADLEPRWSRKLGGIGQVTTIEVTADGGAIAAGSSFAVKLDTKGVVQWSVSFSGADLRTIRQTRDGGYICAGSSAGKPWLAKLSSARTIEWQRTYGGENGIFLSAIEARAGDFVAAGIGAAIVDETGAVVAVANGRGGASGMFKTVVSADLFDTVVPTGATAELP